MPKTGEHYHVAKTFTSFLHGRSIRYLINTILHGRKNYFFAQEIYKFFMQTTYLKQVFIWDVNYQDFTVSEINFLPVYVSDVCIFLFFFIQRTMM